MKILEEMKSPGSSKLDILFVNPTADYQRDQEEIAKRRIEKGVGNQESPHIGMGYLLAVAKQEGLQAKYIDMSIYEYTMDRLLKYIDEHKPRIIGFTAYTIQINAAALIAKEIKKNFPEILICVGGPHVTILAKETLAQFDVFDFVICGEGEEILPQIFECLRQNLPLATIQGVVTRGKTGSSYKFLETFGSLPFPAWDEFDLSKYSGVFPHRTKLELPMTTSRGCPFSCIFCVRPFGQKRRLRPVSSVINEIKRNIKDFGCESIAFIDETFIFDLDWSRKLFATMIHEGLNKKIRWSCETRVDTVSPDLFKLMKSAGCYYVYFGFESGDDTILKTIKKYIKVSVVKQAIQWAKDAGLICAGSFIIGLPGETRESIQRSIDLAKELNIYSTTFPIAVPFPGTVLREMALKHEYGLKIFSESWDDYGKQYPGVMDSETLSIKELRELQQFAYRCLPKKPLPALDEI